MFLTPTLCELMKLLSIKFLIITVLTTPIANGTLDGSQARSDTLIIPLKNRVNFISVEVEMGTPAQKQELLLDTGSFVTWVMGSENPYCKPQSLSSPPEKGSRMETRRGSHLLSKSSIDCQSLGTFNSTLSETYNSTNATQDPLKLTYLDETTVSGQFAFDRFKLPTVHKTSDGVVFQVEDFEIGVGQDTNSTVGILGLGIPTFTFNEKDNWLRYDKQNFISALRANQIIERQVFSIFLNDRQESGGDGELLLGHIDEAKFEGPLYTMKFINARNPGYPIERFEVPLTELFVNIPSRSSNNSERKDVGLFGRIDSFHGKYEPALLDTGSKFTYLPEELYEELVALLDMNHHVKGHVHERLVIPCTKHDDRDNEVFLRWRLNNVVFSLPLRSFLERDSANSSALLKFDSAKNLCQLGIWKSPHNETILGQGFFRSLYAVFDMDSMEVSLAPSKYTGRRAIREITLQEGVNGVKVRSIVDSGADKLVLDPQSDFIMNTRDGFYKYHSSAVARFECKAIMALIINIVTTFILFM